MLQRSPIIRLMSVGVGALAIAALLPSAGLQGQTVRGRVIDATTLAPIPNAEINVTAIDGRGGVARSDSLGAFLLRLPRSGAYWIRASAFGYAPSDSSSIELASRSELLDVLLRLSPQPIEIEGLTVLSRGIELRQRATLEGFRVRHENAFRVGRARVVSKDDPEMKHAFDVADVLQWFPTGRGARCLVVYVDGKVQPEGAGIVELEDRLGALDRIPILHMEGIEFYADPLDAPLELRSPAPPCWVGEFSVLVIWSSPQGGGL